MLKEHILPYAFSNFHNVDQIEDDEQLNQL